MTDLPESGSRPGDAVDATVESRAAAAKEEAARAGAPMEAPGAGPSAARATSARRSFRRAWVLAIAADAVQLVFMPFFVPGGASPVEAGLDLVVSALLIRWCGWHWAFLPSLVAELVPGLDLVPTWTAAVWIATRGRGSAQRPS